MHVDKVGILARACMTELQIGANKKIAIIIIAILLSITIMIIMIISQQAMSAIARLALSPRLSMAAARSLRPATVQVDVMMVEMMMVMMMVTTINMR